jgi:predicted signal transduction protein with EAL and GGDEF domain
VFEARPGKRVQLGISIGAAIFPHDGNTYETLLATADSRMYRDKTSRKRNARAKTGDTPAAVPIDPSPVITASEVERAASGVL